MLFVGLAVLSSAATAAMWPGPVKLSALKQHPFKTSSQFQATFVPQIGADEELYIQSVVISYARNWPKGLKLKTGADTSYPLDRRRPLKGTRRFFTFAEHVGTVPASVPIGTYSFHVTVRGGPTPDDREVVLDQKYELEVLEKLQVSLTADWQERDLPVGVGTTLTATLNNLSTDRMVFINGVVSEGFNVGEERVPTEFLTQDWFDQPLRPTATKTAPLFKITPTSTTPIADINGSLGFWCGPYAGDTHTLSLPLTCHIR